MVEEDTVWLCGYAFPHLRREDDEVITCMLPCIEPEDHWPETPHKCVDGCEWMIDAKTFYAAFRFKEQE